MIDPPAEYERRGRQSVQRVGSFLVAQVRRWSTVAWPLNVSTRIRPRASSSECRLRDDFRAHPRCWEGLHAGHEDCRHRCIGQDHACRRRAASAGGRAAASGVRLRPFPPRRSPAGARLLRPSERSRPASPAPEAMHVPAATGVPVELPSNSIESEPSTERQTGSPCAPGRSGSPAAASGLTQSSGSIRRRVTSLVRCPATVPTSRASMASQRGSPVANSSARSAKRSPVSGTISRSGVGGMPGSWHQLVTSGVMVAAEWRRTHDEPRDPRVLPRDGGDRGRLRRGDGDDDRAQRPRRRRSRRRTRGIPGSIACGLGGGRSHSPRTSRSRRSTACRPRARWPRVSGASGSARMRRTRSSASTLPRTRS